MCLECQNRISCQELGDKCASFGVVVECTSTEKLVVLWLNFSITVRKNSQVFGKFFIEIWLIDKMSILITIKRKINIFFMQFSYIVLNYDTSNITVENNQIIHFMELFMIVIHLPVRGNQILLLFFLSLLLWKWHFFSYGCFINLIQGFQNQFRSIEYETLCDYSCDVS